MLEKNLEHIKKYINAPDISLREITIDNKKVTYIYIESLCSDDKIGDFILKSITQDVKSNNYFDLLNTIPNAKIKKIKKITEAFFYLQNGFTLILTDNDMLVLETKSKIDRGVNTSNNENVIRGPKDSFNENYMTNIGLIRKRIKDDKLTIEENIVGRRTKTKVALIYINDIAKLENIEKINRKIKKIDIDGILDSGYIRDFLIKKTRLFPTVISTERPDLVSLALLEGKIVIMVENSPIAIIMPGLFVDFFNTTEDSFQMASNITFTKIIRYMSFIITLLTPAIFIALTTYHSNLLPITLQSSIESQRANLSIPFWLETIGLILIFEIIRESNIRTPNVMGSSMSIVGGLVLGDAAVSAGIVSAIGVIIVAITSISGLIFSDIDMINSIRLWRIILIALASVLGLYGIAIGIILFIYILAKIKVLDTPYLSPILPFNSASFKNVFLKTPHNKLDKRDNYITNNIKRKK